MPMAERWNSLSVKTRRVVELPLRRIALEAEPARHGVGYFANCLTCVLHEISHVFHDVLTSIDRRFAQIFRGRNAIFEKLLTRGYCIAEESCRRSYGVLGCPICESETVSD